MPQYSFTLSEKIEQFLNCKSGNFILHPKSCAVWVHANGITQKKKMFSP